MRRGGASLFCLLFLLSQVLPPSFAVSLGVEYELPFEIFPAVEESADTAAQKENTQLDLSDPTTQFLGYGDSPLQAVEEEEDTPVTAEEVRDGEEYPFDEALGYLTPEYAAAVIVESVTAEDLRTLAELDIEVGVAVIKGKIVLFTSGNEDEIRVLPVAQDLLESAGFFAHTHPSTSFSAKPSAEDFAAVGEAIEYVVGAEGVYAFNQDGLMQETPFDEHIKNSTRYSGSSIRCSLSKPCLLKGKTPQANLRGS